MSNLWTEKQVEEADRRLTDLGHVAMSVLMDIKDAEIDEAWELIHEMRERIELMQSKLMNFSEMVWEVERIGGEAIKKFDAVWEKNR